MSSKVLIPQAIIPQNLYVYRDADRDIEYLLKDMGRPGYVLVARQMGKTNLLLNAKRNLIGVNDASVYVDFSNAFRSARECFRHIIDLIIETNADKLYFIKESIKKGRQENDLADHIEHELELRKVLESLKGKLVVIIDEVDAITTVGFSDTIFKQIRSAYFASRTNFPVLNNLTYILAGVGEPSSLIKDPKISPFNIGQEIFLGDFSFEEFQDFLKKGKIEINLDVVHRIYYWTNGNPRMTYEVCSSVEDTIKEISDSGFSIDVDAIDAIVHRMYLTTFDRVPLDNIRGMIQSDTEMLEAVKSIKAKKLALVTTAQRRKLYLAGIVGADFESDKISIKNRIIAKALSDEWLQEVTKPDGVISRAAIAFSIGRYDEVIELVENVLSDYTSEEEFIILHNMIVTAYYERSKYKKMLEHFNHYSSILSLPVSQIYEQQKLDSLYLYANALYYSNSYANAAKIFQQIIFSSNRRKVYFNSMLGLANLVSSVEILPEELSRLDAVSLYERVFEELDEVGANLIFEEKQHFKSIAFYNLGLLYKEKGDKTLALINFKNSLNVASDASRAVILYNISSVCNANEERIYLEKSLNAIVVNKAKPQNFSISSPLLVSYSIILEVAKKLLASNKAEVAKLISYIYTEELKASFPANDELYSRLSKEDNIAREQIIVISFTDFIDALSIEQMVHGYSVFKESSILSINSSKPFVEALMKYDLVKELDEIDVLQMIVVIRNYIPNNIKLAMSIISYIRGRYPRLDNKHSVEYILMNFFEMQAYDSLSKSRDVFEKAEALLLSFQKFDMDNIDYPFIKKAELIEIRALASINYTKFLTVTNTSNVKKNLPIPDRNRKVTVVYANGEQLTDKFKRFEKDIFKGRCKLI